MKNDKSKKPSTTKGVLTQNERREIFNSLIRSRERLIKSFLDGRKDINKSCDYPTDIKIENFQEMFDRESHANRVVSIWPNECWKKVPTVFETEKQTETAFEKAWDELVKAHNNFHYLHRIDKLSGIGHYGILFLGIDDGKDPKEEVDGLQEDGTIKPGRERKLLFVRPYSEQHVKILEFDTDPTSPRYGLPKRYSISQVDFTNSLGQAAADGMTGKDVSGAQINGMEVHWTRVIHVADNRESSEVFGVPRQRPVYNRLLDIRKLAAGSAEMYWKGAFPGLAITANAEELSEVPDLDSLRDTMKDQIYDYQNDLQRFIAALGFDVKMLAPTIVDPTQQIECQIMLICIALEVPKRKFMGSEQGELASSEDSDTWAERVMARCDLYLTPLLVRLLVDRLIALAVLPTPTQYDVFWPDLLAPTKKDKADLAHKQAEALAKWMGTPGLTNVIEPLSFLTVFLGLELDEAEALLEAAEKWAEEHADELEEEAALLEEEENPDDEQTSEEESTDPITEEEDDAEEE